MSMVDWERWHDLLDIRAQRPLTTPEGMEYERFRAIAAQLDAEQGKAAGVGLDKLCKGHMRVIDSIKRTTAAIERANDGIDGATTRRIQAASV